MTRIKEFAPAKINLWLHVLGRRPDGLHELDSLVAFLDYGDRIAIEPAHELSLSITGPFAGRLAEERRNLALTAAKAVAAAAGREPRLHISLEKYLPVAGGIGGGSADAAAVIRGLARFWKLDWPIEARIELAATLGADVPVCLEGRPAVVRGIGEKLSYLPRFPAVPGLLVNPGIGIRTEEVFRRRAGPFSTPAPFPSDLAETESLFRLISDKRNDLYPPALALAPVVSEVLAEIEALEGCRIARMSGSGSTCFALFETPGLAERAAHRIEAHHPDWWVYAGTIGGRLS
jgi:4-diphosphocytidyl-2-C-methyl-D-erythritol kinase